jgi:hypothetical protein
MEVSTGGVKRVQVYRAKADMSEIYAGISGTEQATSKSDVAFLIGKGKDEAGSHILIQTDFSKDTSGVLTLKFNQLKGGEKFHEFEKAFFPAKAGVNSTNKTEELYAQDGEHVGGEAATMDQQLAILAVYGALNDDGVIEVDIVPGYFSKQSGGKSYVNGKYVSPSIEFTSTKALTVPGVGTGAPDTGLIFPAELLDDDIVTPDGDIEVEPDYYYEAAFLEPAS